jgi:hypothetical protein
MERLAYQTDIPTKFCFFIDGLDEYGGDHSEIIRLLSSLKKSSNIKMCISSRPLNMFEDAYGRSKDRKLYLQDLARDDIRKYVSSKFEEHPAWDIVAVDDSRSRALLDEINKKAQGVFLWVFLVVRSLLEELTNGDTFSFLEERLRQIPTDLKHFFKYMLDSLDPVYNRHLAPHFWSPLKLKSLCHY